MIVRVMLLLAVDNEVNDAEVEQVQQLIDTLHAHVHSNDVQVRNSALHVHLVRVYSGVQIYFIVCVRRFQQLLQ